MFFESKMKSALKSLGYPMDGSSKKSISLFSSIYRSHGENPKEAAVKYFYTTIRNADGNGVRLDRENIAGAKITIDDRVKKRQIRPHYSVAFAKLVASDLR